MYFLSLPFLVERWSHAHPVSSKWIEDQVAKGCTIVCDRYYYSGMVYSAAKKNPTLTLEWAKHPEVGLPRPDAVVFLDLDPDEAAKRGGYGEEKYEKREMQERVRELFFDMEYFHGDEADMMVVNAAASVEEVHDRIMAEIKEILTSVAKGDFGREIRKVNPW
jgi:dTMP kinase